MLLGIPFAEKHRKGGTGYGESAPATQRAGEPGGFGPKCRRHLAGGPREQLRPGCPARDRGGRPLWMLFPVVRTWLAGDMKSVALSALVRHCDARLKPESFVDYDGAVNGLQFENRGRVHRIAAAVDGTLTVARQAVAAGADLLLVHHGLFWGKTVPWTGRRAELLRLLVEYDLAVYSQHLPLDGHSELGNAAQLARALSLKRQRPFFERKGSHLGVQATLTRPLARDELRARLVAVLGGPVTLLPGGGEMCRRIGICTGGAGAELVQAQREGVDTFITGEGPHWTHALAEEAGINVLYGGHYATETFGVKALAAELARKFGVPWVFVDHPSGL